MAWKLAPSLVRLRQQINDRWPSRSRVSDGTVGDAAHRNRKSDHNPNAAGIVMATDITHDPTSGPDGMVLSTALTRDYRTKYVIHRGRIWKARTGQWEPYRGPNPHNHHVHLSVKAEQADDRGAWVLDETIPLQSYPVLKRGDRGQAVRSLQEKLRVEVDGIFGPATEAKVKQLQAAHGLKADGIVGPLTWEALN